MTAILAPWAAIVIALVSAFAALLTYRRNSQTKRAEFLLELHKSFFVDETYKPLRTLMDDSDSLAQQKLQSEIAKESPEFTDFLNFFELIAYFRSSKTLRHRDVQALLGYYLDLMKNDLAISAYIGKKSTTFEHLNALLKLKTKECR